jgi:membrane-bound serine protease (ClpP class)
MTDGIWILLLVILGMGLLLAELFIPGMVLGIAGGCCLIASIGWSYKIYGTTTGIGVLVGEIILVSIGLWRVMERLPQSRWGKKAMLLETNENREMNRHLEKFVGQNGKATTLCRPVGFALVLGERVEVIAETGYIEPGKPIVVTHVEGLQLRVKEIV